MLIEVRCDYCNHLLCKVSKDFFGVVELWCRHCKQVQLVSLSFILKQLADEPAILAPTTQVNART